MFNERERRVAINNTAELYNAIAKDIADKIVRSSYADVIGVKRTVAENLKLYFRRYSMNCYFVDQAISNSLDVNSLQSFGRELMNDHKMPFQDVVRAEAALVQAVQDLHDEIDEICKKRQKEFPSKIAKKREELMKAANADAKLMAARTLEVVGNVATVIGLVGVVLSVMFPPLAVAAAGAGITSGIITLSAGTAALSFAVPAATAVIGYAMSGMGMVSRLDIESDIEAKLR